MEIKSGHYKTVFILEKIVIKFPRIRFKDAFLASKRLNSKGRLFDHLIKIRNYKAINTDYASIQVYLFRAIIENFFELVFYKKYKFNFLVPTYYSFFGLFTIQKKVKQYNSYRGEHWIKLVKVLDNDIYRGGHTFMAEENYGFDEGKLKILDYGDKRVRDVLLEYSKGIEDDFIILEKDYYH